MDYQLKKLSTKEAAHMPAACVLMLVTQATVNSAAEQVSDITADGLSSLLSNAQQAGDFDGSSGQLLSAMACTA